MFTGEAELVSNRVCCSFRWNDFVGVIHTDLWELRTKWYLGKWATVPGIHCEMFLSRLSEQGVCLDHRSEKSICCFLLVKYSHYIWAVFLIVSGKIKTRGVWKTGNVRWEIPTGGLLRRTLIFSVKAQVCARVRVNTQSGKEFLRSSNKSCYIGLFSQGGADLLGCKARNSTFML